jgi:hydroxymethylglutaryl-CoA lyase
MPLANCQNGDPRPTAAPLSESARSVARRPAEPGDDADGAGWNGRGADAGLREIEVGSSFRCGSCRNSPTRRIVARSRRRPHGVGAGAESRRRARDRYRADLMLLPLSASHAHSLANLRKTPDADRRVMVAIRDTVFPGGSRPASAPPSDAPSRAAEPDEVLRLVALHWRRVPSEWPADTVVTPIRRWRRCSCRPSHERLSGAFPRHAASPANVFAAWQQGRRAIRRVSGRPGGCSHAPGERERRHRGRRYLFGGMGGNQPRPSADRARTSLAQARRRDAVRTLWRAGLPKTMAAR